MQTAAKAHAAKKRALRGFLDNRVDGLIVNTCGSNDEYLLELQERGIPLVLADRPLMEPGLIDTVCSRNQEKRGRVYAPAPLTGL